MVARGDHRGLRRRGRRLPGEDQVLRLPDHPGARGDRARRAGPADRAGDRGRRGRDRDAVPALPPLARRLAVEAEGARDRRASSRFADADPPPLAADRRRRRARGIGAEVQAPRRLGRARCSRSSRSERKSERVRHRSDRRGGSGPVRAAARAVLAAWALRHGARVGLVRGRLGAAAERRRAAAELPPELDGPAHRAPVGLPPRRAVARRAAVERAVRWVEERQPDLVAVTGDLLSHPRGERTAARRCCRGSRRCYAVLGNHDFGDARDPLAASVAARDLSPARAARATSPSRSSARPARADRRRRSARVSPRDVADPARLADPDADLRILLCHYPSVFDAIRPGAFDLVLAGHLHDGPDRVPYGRAARCGSRICAGGTRGRLPRATAPCCTSRPGSGRRSCRSGSSRAPRRQSSSCPAE